MNTRHMLLLAGAALLLVITPGTSQAQDDEDDGHIFTVANYQWPFNNLPVNAVFILLYLSDSQIVGPPGNRTPNLRTMSPRQTTNGNNQQFSTTMDSGTWRKPSVVGCCH